MKPKPRPSYFRFGPGKRYEKAGVRRMRRHMFGPVPHKPIQDVDDLSAPGGQLSTSPPPARPEPGT
jgi:hypothetical protein